MKKYLLSLLEITMGRIQILKKRMIFHITLISKSPVNYLYSYMIPSQGSVQVMHHDVKSRSIAKEIIRKINREIKDVQIYYIGSSSLGITGVKDIDLMAACSYKDFKRTLPKFITLFGEPKKKREKFIEWNFIYKDFTIELDLIDPTIAKFSERIEVFNILKNDKTLLKEYENLKKKLNGFSLRDYQREKLHYFNSIIENYRLRQKNSSVKIYK